MSFLENYQGSFIHHIEVILSIVLVMRADVYGPTLMIHIADSVTLFLGECEGETEAEP